MTTTTVQIHKPEIDALTRMAAASQAGFRSYWLQDKIGDEGSILYAYDSNTKAWQRPLAMFLPEPRLRRLLQAGLVEKRAADKKDPKPGIQRIGITKKGVALLKGGA